MGILRTLAYLVVTGATMTAGLMVTRAQSAPGGRANQSALSKSGRSGDRVIRLFDFNERPQGNLEPVPMLWTRHESPGFPSYAVGRFDLDTGYDSPPSFYLESRGRSCAYHYRGLDIDAEPHTDYRIAARIKPDRLTYARAYISAYLLDADGVKIDGTERRSRFVDGASNAEQWQDVSVRLLGNVDGAYSIGLAVWVVQRSEWWFGAQPLKHIDHKDVHGGAWFDDISVYRLPSVDLSTTAAAAGNIYAADAIPILLVRGGDSSFRELQTRLTVRDAAGRIVRREQIGLTQPAESRTRQIELSALPPGAYHAHLSVDIEQGKTIDRYLTFINLAPELDNDHRLKSRYGVILDPEVGRDWSIDGAMLASVGVKNVKVPLMSEMPSEGDAQMLFDAFIEQQSERQMRITGTIVNPRITEFDDAAGSTPSLLDWLSKPTPKWQPIVADWVTKYQSQVQDWQVGRDARQEIVTDTRLEKVLTDLRSEMAKLTTSPILVAPWSTRLELGPRGLPADIISLAVPATIPPSEIPAQLDEPLQKPGHHRVWAVLEFFPQQTYKRLPHLADFAKRLIFASQSSADKIFVRQPWRSRPAPGGPITEASELLPVFRTIVSLLDGTRYIGTLAMGSDISCHAFDRSGETVLAIWNDRAPLEGRSHKLHLAGANKVADVWGVVRALDETDSLATLTLSPLPVFVFFAETWLVSFRRGLRFDPPLLPSEWVSHEQRLLIENPRKEPISGSIKLKAPAGWRIRPTEFTFAAQPGETVSQMVRIQSAPRAPAGQHQIETSVTIDAAHLYQFDTQLPLKLDLADMDVWVDVILEGDTVILQHGITNRSDSEVTFRSFADALGRKRQHLNIIGLQPNQTVVKAHRFDNAAQLSGEVIRIGLTQVNGPRSHNIMVTIP